MRKKIAMIVSVILFLVLSLNGKAIYAASASVAFSATSGEYVVGETFMVTLTAESSAGVSGFQTYVAYDPNALELVDTGHHVTGSDGLLFISDLEGSDQVREYHMKFKAKQTGNTEVYISDTIYMYSATKEQMSVSKNSLNIRINGAETEVSSNKGLASLTVSNGQLFPAFDSEIYEYRVEVPSDTEILYVDAKARLKAYTVKVSGNDKLQYGDNTATVVVTDKEGSEKLYTILIHKLSPQEEELALEEEEEEQEGTGPVSEVFSVYKDAGSLHISSTVDLEVVPVPSVSVIPKGYVESAILLNQQEVTVYVPEEKGVNDFVLIYGKIGVGASKFYVFDRVGQTIHRFDENDQGNRMVEQDADGQRSVLGCYIAIVLLLFTTLFLASRLLKMKRLLVDALEEYEED